MVFLIVAILMGKGCYLTLALICIFLTQVKLKPFQKFIGCTYFLFYKVPVHVSCLFFFWIIFFLVICCWYVYISIYSLYISIYEPLLVKCVVNIFPSCGLAFSQFIIIVVVSFFMCWGHEDYFPVLSSETFIAFSFSNLILCVVGIQFYFFHMAV